MIDRALRLWAMDLAVEIGGIDKKVVNRVLVHAHALGTPIPDRYVVDAFLLCYVTPPDRKTAREVLIEMGMLVQE